MGVEERYQNKKKNEDEKKVYGGVEHRYITKNIGTIAENITNSVNSWLSDYDSLANDYISRYTNVDGSVYRSDAADWLSKIQSRTQSNKKKALETKAMVDQYKNYLDPEWVSNFYDVFSNTDKYRSNMIDEAKQEKGYWEKWDSEDAYYNDYFGQKYAGKTYDDIVNALEATDGKERDWLTSNADSYMTLEDIDMEIDRLLAEWSFPDENGNIPDHGDRIKELRDLRPIVERREAIEKFNQYLPDAYEWYGNWEGPREPSTDFEDINKGIMNSDGNKGIPIIPTPGGTRNSEFMTYGEGILYAYLKEHPDVGDADEYIDALQVELDRRKQKQDNDWYADKLDNGNFGEKALLQIASIGGSIGGGIPAFIEDTYYSIKGESINPYSPAHSLLNMSQTIRSETAENIAEDTNWEIGGYNVASSIYQFGMSAVDSYLGGRALGEAYLVLAGTNAASSKMKELYERGASNKQVFIGGIASGLAEAAFEKIPLDNLLNPKASATFLEVPLEIAKQAGLEGLEEALTESANVLFDQIIMGDRSSLNLTIKKYTSGYYDEDGKWHDPLSTEEATKKAYTEVFGEILYATIGGMVSGGMVSAPGIIIQTAVNSNTLTNNGKDIISTTGGFDALKNLANEASSEGLVKGEGDIKSLLAKAQTGVDAYNDGNTSKRQKNKTAKQVGKLSQAVETVRNEQNLAEIRSSLESKGLSRSRAKKAAELLGEALYTDGPYSKELYKSVMNDEGVWDTLRELVSSPDSSLKNRNIKHTLGRMGLKVGEGGNIISSVEESNFVDEDLSFVKDASKREYEASVEGKSIDKSTGKVIDIVEVASIKDGKMMLKVKDADGAESVVNAKNVEYASESEALIYEAVAHMGLDAVSANSIVQSYNPSQNAEVFVMGVQEAYRYGRYNFSEYEMYQEGNFLTELTEEQIQRAYKLGQIRSGSDTAVAVAKLKEAIANSKGKKGEGKIHYEGDAVAIDEENLNDRQKTALKTMEMLSKTLGVEFYVYASYVNENGERVYKTAEGEVKSAPNGWYDKATGAIHIDLNAGETGRGTMLFTVAHELTHFIKAWSPAKFKVLANFLVEQYGKKGVSVETLVRNQMEHMKASGRKNVTYDLAFEEFVADSMETMLTSGNVMESLAEIKRRDEGLWNKIKEFFANLVELLKETVKAYSGFAPDTIEGRTVAEMTDVIEQFEKLFTEGLVDASENFRAISSTEQLDKEFGEGEMYSLRGKAEDGKKIYESNFPKGTPKAAKSDRILDYIQNVWSKKPISLVISNGETSRTILAQFDPTLDEARIKPSDASKLAGGNRHGTHSEQRVTLDLADDYYEIASEATYNYSKLETGKDSDTHTDVKMWHYFVNDIYFAEYGETEYTPYTVTINVKEKDSGDFVYSFNAEKEPSTRQTLHADVNTRKGINGELFLEDIITQPSNSVKAPDENPHSDRKIVEIPNNKYAEMYHHFGSTKNYDVAGYMLGNGVMLDFSGKHWGDDYSTSRQVDHRDVQEVLDDRGNNGVNAMIDMIGNGNIRLMPEVGGINLAVKPNATQMSVLRGYINHFKGEVVIDIDKVGGYTIHSFSYTRGTSSSKILSDLKAYFDEGIVPEQKASDETDIHQFLYSERNKDSVSNRALLANALESTVQSEIERKTLDEYKEELGRADALERELHEIRSKIRDLSFAKGPKDTEGLRKLREQERKTVNRIDIRDKKLLRLEATRALKDIIHREKEKAYKRAEQKGKEALAKYREKSAETQRELLNRWKESRKEAVENRHKSEVRIKIKNFKTKLEGMLQHPTDRQYVPMGLANAMIEVCELINTDTSLYHKDGSINKAQERRDLIKARLNDLKNEYEKLKKHTDPMYSGEFDETIYEYLTELQENFGGKNLNDMTLDELREMYETLRAIEETLRDARKLIGYGDAYDVYEAGDAIASEQAEIAKKRKNGHRNSAQKTRDKTLNYTLSPVRNVERMSGYHENSLLLKLFKKFEQGIRKKNKFVMESYKLFEPLTTGENAKTYEDAIYKEYGDKKFTDINGRTFGISKMQMMQTILSYEREVANGMHHIEGSGFSFADLDMLRKGKLKDAVSEEYSHRVPSAVDMVQGFKEALEGDKWVQDYMAAARQFFNEKAKDAINETMLAMKHRIVAKDKNYIPFEVDKNFVVREISAGNDIQQTINSYGMLKETKAGASQPLIITGLNNILDRHIDQVGNVHGLAIEVRNFNKVWNVRTMDSVGSDPTVKAAIQRNWGVEGVKHIEQAVQDIQGSRQSEQSALYRKIKSGYIGATFLLNLSVVSKQIGSLFTATSMLRYRSPIRMMGNLIYTMANHKKISAEVDKYTATAWMRRQGLSDAELQTLLTEGKKTLFGKLATKLPSAINPTKWIAAMDSAVALSLWKYAKKDTAKRTGLKGEELLKATAEFYDEVVENTQSMTDVLHRPEVQKRGDLLSETLGIFKTDLYQMAGQLQVTAGRYTANKSKANASALVRTASSVVMSAVWAQLMTTLFALLRYKVDRYRDEEDEELSSESWLKRQSFSLVGDLVGYLFPLAGSELVGIMEMVAYGEPGEIVDNIVLTAINDVSDIAITIASSVKDGEMPSASDTQRLLNKALQMFGVPANNISRLVNAITLHAKDIANGEFLSFEAGVERNSKHHVHRIVEAMASGKTDVAVGLFEEAVEELALRKAKDGEVGKEELDDAKSSLKTALGNQYKEGEIDFETAATILSDIFGMSEDDIYWQFDKWDYAVKNGTTDGYAKYDDFLAAVETGKDLKAVIQVYLDNGVEEKTLASQITSYFKPLYKEMTNAERAALKGYLLNAYVLLGYKRSEKSKDINEWLKD